MHDSAEGGGGAQVAPKRVPLSIASVGSALESSFLRVKESLSEHPAVVS